MKNRNYNARVSMAKGLVALVRAGADSSVLSEYLSACNYTPAYKDTTARGCGNAAARRMGVDTSDTSCGCVVCTVYGGDCSYTMMREGRGEEHRSRRGQKTRGTNENYKPINGGGLAKVVGANGARYLISFKDESTAAILRRAGEFYGVGMRHVENVRFTNYGTKLGRG